MQALIISPVSPVQPKANGQNQETPRPDSTSFEEVLSAETSTQRENAQGDDAIIVVEDIDVAASIDAQEEVEVGAQDDESFSEFSSDFDNVPDDLHLTEMSKVVPAVEPVTEEGTLVSQRDAEAPPVQTTRLPEAENLEPEPIVAKAIEAVKTSYEARYTGETSAGKIVSDAPAEQAVHQRITTEASTRVGKLQNDDVEKNTERTLTGFNPSQTSIQQTAIQQVVAPKPASTPTEPLFQLAPQQGHFENKQFKLTWPAQETATVSFQSQQGTTVQLRSASPAQIHVESLLNNEARFVSGIGVEAPIDGESLHVTDTGRSRVDSALNAQTVVSLAQNRAEIPPNIARQIAEVIQRSPDRSVELSLSPAELGNVRMKLSPGEAGITVSIFAERPETLELMRRNIDSLEKAIAEIGYADVSFDFSTGTESDQNTDLEDQATQNGLAQEDNTVLETGTQPSNSALRVAANGLDVRV